MDEIATAQLKDVASLALEEARRQGASQCEADASVSQGLSVNVRLREVDTVEYQRDRGLGVTVYFGKRKGSASTADLSAAAVRETVEKACAIARYTAEDEYAGLVEPEALARDIPDLDLDHPWDLTPERAIELARECEAAGLAVDARSPTPRARRSAASATPACTAIRSASSPAIPRPAIRSAASLLAQEGEDMQRDYWYAHRARRRGAGGGRRHRPARRRARAGAPRRAAAHDAQGAGGFRARNGARPVPPLRRRHLAARASTASPRSCSTPPASRCFRRSSACRSGRTSRKALASSPFDERRRGHP